MTADANPHANENKTCCERFAYNLCQCGGYSAKLFAKFEELFERWGSFVARYPIPIIVVVAVLTTILSAGLTRQQTETDIFKLWIERSSPLNNERAFVNQYFAAIASRPSFLMATAKNPELYGTNILTRNHLDEMLRVMNNITFNLQMDYYGDIYHIYNLCSRPDPPVGTDFFFRVFGLGGGTPCTKATPLDCFAEGIYDYKLPNLASFRLPNRYLTRPSFYNTSLELTDVLRKPCEIWAGYPLPENFMFGGVVRDANRNVLSVASFQNYLELAAPLALAKFLFCSDRFCTPTQAQQDTALDILKTYELAYMNYVSKIETKYINLQYFTERSGDDLVNDASSSDIALIYISYCLMVLFAAFTMIRYNRVTSRVLLGFLGVCCILLSTLSALGFTSWVGVKQNPSSMQVLPFLTLGFCVDDMFVVGHSTIVTKGKSLDQIARATGKESGVGITIAAVINIISFFVGAAHPLTSVANFSLSAAFSVIINFIVILGGFFAIVMLDARRIQANRCDMLPCIVSSTPLNLPTDEEAGVQNNHEESHAPEIALTVNPSTSSTSASASLSRPASSSLSNESAPHAEKKEVAAASAISEHKSESFKTVASTSQKEAAVSNNTHEADDRGCCHRNGFLLKHETCCDHFWFAYTRALLHPVIGTLAFLSMVALFAVAIVGITKIEDGLPLADIVPKDHYAHPWLQTRESYYGDYQAFLVFGMEKDGSTASTTWSSILTQIMDLQNQVATIKNVQHDVDLNQIPIQAQSWVDNFLLFCNKDLRNASSGACLQGINCTYYNFISADSYPMYTYFATVADKLTGKTGINYGLPYIGIPKDENIFYWKFREFISSDYATIVAGQFAFSDDGLTMLVSKIPFYQTNLYTTQDFIDMIKDTRAITSAAPINVFPAGFVYTFYEQYVHSREYLSQQMGYVTIGIFLSAWLFLLHLGATIILCACVAVCITQIYGFCYFMGVLAVNLSMATGVSVVFVVHIVRTFLTAKGKTNKERVVNAVGPLGKPMFSAAVASLLGVLLLAFARFPYFRLYYFDMYVLVVVFGLLNGLVLLPLILAMPCSPRSFEEEHEHDQPKSVSVKAP